jgi:hypothetical protein
MAVVARLTFALHEQELVARNASHIYSELTSDKRISQSKERIIICIQLLSALVTHSLLDI